MAPVCLSGRRCSRLPRRGRRISLHPAYRLTPDVASEDWTNRFHHNGQPAPYQQPAYTMNCYTPAGPIVVNNPMIVGSQCYAMTPMGTFYSQAGY